MPRCYRKAVTPAAVVQNSIDDEAKILGHCRSLPSQKNTMASRISSAMVSAVCPVSSQKMWMALASASPTNKPARIHHARVCVAWQPAEHSVDRRPDQQTRHVEHGVDAGDDGWGMHG